MTIQEALRQGTGSLRNVATPLLDATVLLSEALGITKERLYASLPEGMEDSEYLVYRRFLSRRRAGTPVSYIRRKKEFCSLDFFVDERVFVPRPATEILVDAALDTVRGLLQSSSHVALHDACTGSGCVAIALKKKESRIAVSASDVSEHARAVFDLNCLTILGIGLSFRISNLLEEISGPFDLVTANPPYLTDERVDEMLRLGWPEPEIALRGGSRGLELLFRIIDQASARLNPRGVLLLEADPQQMLPLMARFAEMGYSSIRLLKDLSGCDRIISGRAP
jgi:release factor glutamine methyltransferase